MLTWRAGDQRKIIKRVDAIVRGKDLQNRCLLNMGFPERGPHYAHGEGLVGNEVLHVRYRRNEY